MKLDQRGFTLIELIAVMAVLMLILAGVFSMMIFYQRMFLTGTHQVDLHSAVRQAAESINQNVRFAFFMQIVDESEWDPDTVDSVEYSYIYYDSAEQKVFLLDRKLKQ